MSAPKRKINPNNSRISFNLRPTKMVDVEVEMLLRVAVSTRTNLKEKVVVKLIFLVKTIEFPSINVVWSRNHKRTTCRDRMLLAEITFDAQLTVLTTLVLMEEVNASTKPTSKRMLLTSPTKTNKIKKPNERLRLKLRTREKFNLAFSKMVSMAMRLTMTLMMTIKTMSSRKTMAKRTLMERMTMIKISSMVRIPSRTMVKKLTERKNLSRRIIKMTRNLVRSSKMI